MDNINEKKKELDYLDQLQNSMIHPTNDLTIEELKNMYNIVKNDIEEKKIKKTVLEKLKILDMFNGVKLSREYDMDSDIEQMIEECEKWMKYLEEKFMTDDHTSTYIEKIKYLTQIMESLNDKFDPFKDFWSKHKF
jgi:hypothetical protein